MPKSKNLLQMWTLVIYLLTCLQLRSKADGDFFNAGSQWKYENMNVLSCHYHSSSTLNFQACSSETFLHSLRLQRACVFRSLVFMMTCISWCLSYLSMPEAFKVKADPSGCWSWLWSLLLHVCFQLVFYLIESFIRTRTYPNTNVSAFFFFFWMVFKVCCPNTKISLQRWRW